MHVGPVAARSGEHLEPGLRVDAEHPVVTRRREELQGSLNGELIGDRVLRDVGLVLATQQVGAVLADPRNHRDTLRVDSERNGADVTGIDVADVLGHHSPKPDLAVGGGGVAPEVETTQPRHRFRSAVGDLVELVLHAGREGVIDEIREMTLQQRDHGKGREGGDERRALLPHVAAVLNRPDGRGIGRGAPDPELLEGPHQTGLRVARRRAGLMAAGRQRLRVEQIALTQRRQSLLGVLVARILVGPLDVRPLIPREGDDRATRRELDVTPRGTRGAEANGHGLTHRVVHLRCNCALPDHLVHAGLGRADLGCHGLGIAETVAGGTNRLVGLLGVLHLLRIQTRRVGQVLVAEALGDQRTGSRECRVGQGGAVGSHVGDVATLVEALGSAHGLRRGHPKLASRLLLEGGGHERRRRTTAVGLGVHRTDRQRAGRELRGKLLGAHPVEDNDVVAADPTVLAEVLPRGEPDVVDGNQACPHQGPRRARGGPRHERAIDTPVLGGTETHAGPLALDDDTRRHTLHAPGGELRHDLLPQHGTDLVAVEAIEDPPGLLRVDQATIDVARIGDGVLDRGSGDLVEHHAPNRDLRAQHLEEVPRDRFSLAVLVGCEIDLAGVLHQPLQLGDMLLLLTGDHVQRLEPVVDVDAEPRPSLALVRQGDVGGVARQVPDVPDRGFDDVTVAQETRDRSGFGG